MEIDLNKDELEFLMRFCKRSIQVASELGEKCGTIFDPERGENIEKATILYNKLKQSYKNKDETENIRFHPWENFHKARYYVILLMQQEGKSDVYIADALSTNAQQVFLIRKHGYV